jgi:type I restriction enzyme S subunit
MQNYKVLLAKTDELVKSQFIELFGQLPEHFKHETVELGNIADMLSGGTPSSKHPEYYGDKYPFVTTPCLGKNYIDESDAVNWLSEIGVKKSSTHIIPANSVMYGSRVGVGKSSINTCKMCTNQDILSFFNIDESKYDLLFIKKVMDQYFDYIDTQKRGATIKGVPSDIVKAIKIPVVPIDEQHAFAEFTEQSDKSKFELNRALDELTATYKQIIKDYLG